MKKIYILLLMLAVRFTGHAQTSNIYFNHIGIKDGLPEPAVSTIIEDSEGYIWMGTQNGLVRYDGYQYHVYNLGSEKVNKHSSTSVMSIWISKNKDLWVTTVDDGLFKYNRYTNTFEQFYYPVNERCDAYIDNEDHEGNLWGHFYFDHSRRRVIFKFNVSSHKFEFFGNVEKGYNQVNAKRLAPVAITSNGTVWIPTSNGLYRYNGESKPFTGFFTTKDTAQQKSFYPVYEAPSQPGVFWINVRSQADFQIIRWDTKNNAIKEYSTGRDSAGKKADTVNSIYEDTKKQLWFATTEGLSKFDRGTEKFSNYTAIDTVKSARKNSLSNFTETNDGILWLPSPVGLVNFNPVTAKFNRFIPDEGNPGAISGFQVRKTLVDHSNTLWLSVADGINKIDKLKSVFKVYKNNNKIKDSWPGANTNVITITNLISWVVAPDGIYKWDNGTDKLKKFYSTINSEKITASCKGKNGLIYITTPKSLQEYNTVTNQIKQCPFMGVKNMPVADFTFDLIYQDKVGILWLGSERGLYSFDTVSKKYTSYPYRTDRELTTTKNNGALDDGGIQSIYEDHENNLWVGTNHGGLNRFDRNSGKFISYFNESNKLVHCVPAIFEDSYNRLWVGTAFNGLFQFDLKKGIWVRNINERSGLIFNSVAAINQDYSNNIWILTGRGFSRLEVKSLSIKNFYNADILPGEDINSDDFRNLTLMPGGQFVFGLNNGAAVFDPEKIKANPVAPIVHLVSINYNNPHADTVENEHIFTYGLKALKLPYNQNRLRFNYIALHYDKPEENRYAYQLDGYDKSLVQAGTQRSVTYNNLSPGTYTFHVIAANSDGVWNRTGDSFTVIILRPWWAKWWALLLYLAVLGCLVYAISYYRSFKLRKENQLLEERVSLRTNQLSEANQQLNTANEELNEQREEIVNQRDKLSETVNDLQATQTQLIQSEKLASLGELTAGIAHEIQNPLNFVNNFSEVNHEMLHELADELKAGNIDEALLIAADIIRNEEKIIHHGKRADAIVKNMLQHSRSNGGEKQLTDVNALADEYFRLSYHGLRAKEKSFNAELVTNLDPSLPQLKVIPQDIGRVLLNLFNNAFYAVNQKQKTAGPDYKPTVTVTTFASSSGGVVVTVKDNGNGIPDAIKDKIMQPFFTTKPTGEGTGLGLSLSYDIVVKGHGGKIDIISEEQKGSEFVIVLPVTA